MPRRRSHSRCRGLALVETSLVMVWLILMVFAVIEYGWMFTKQQQLTNAARQGARVAVTADATNTDVEAAVDALMSSAGMGSSGYTVSYSPSDVGLAEKFDMVTVTITVNYNDNLEIINFPLLPAPTALRATVTMSKEGP